MDSVVARGERISEESKTEIIAFCSGKGGTGKSLMCACFGYALLRGGHRVLMIDGDPATDGLSLFLLGPKGQDQVSSFAEQSTFIGSLDRYQKAGSGSFEPRAIYRLNEDHGVTYHAIISGRGLYGDGTLNMPVVPDLNQGVFRAGIRHLFDQLRTSGEYDYVLVDTRGGFAFESTDLCALADSYIVITEPDYTSFYQDRNLVSRVSAAARDVEFPSLLRAMIVNKAVDSFPNPGKPYLDTLEVLFRDQLVKEFPVSFKDTHAVPVSIEALLAYKAQKIPYTSAPESMFCVATLSAFSDILGTVTSKWSEAKVKQWNELIDSVEQAVKRKQALEAEKEQARLAHEQEFERLRTTGADSEARVALLERESAAKLEALQHGYEVKIASLERELEQRNLQYEREFARSEALITTTIMQAGGGTGSYGSAAPVTGSRPVMAPAPAPPVLASSPSFDGASKPAIAEFALSQRPRGVGVPLLLLAVVAVLILGGYLAWHGTRRVEAPARTVGAGDTSTTLHASPVDPADAGSSGPVASPAPKRTAPAPSSLSSSPSKERTILNNYAVLLAGGKALTATGPGTPSAAYEAQLAMQAGYSVSLYQRAGRYTAAVLWDSQPQAEEALKAIQTPFDGRWSTTSSVVTMSDWCPVKTALDPVVINNTNVPVWSCLTFPSQSSGVGKQAVMRGKKPVN